MGPTKRSSLVVVLAAFASVALAGCGGGSAAGVAGGAGPGGGPLPPLKIEGPPVVVDLSAPIPSCPEPAPPAPPPKEQPAFLIQRGHSRPITQVALSGDGRVMATAALDGTVRIWDTTSGLLVRKILTEGMSPKITLARGGSMLAYYAPDATVGGTTTISLVDLAAGAPPRSVTRFGEMALSPDGKLFAVALTQLTLYDSLGAKLKELDLGLKPGQIAHTIEADPAFERLAVAAAGEIIVVDVRAWTIARRFPLPNPAFAADYAAQIAWCPSALALRNLLGAVQIVDLTGTPRFRLPAPRYTEIAAAGDRLWTIEPMKSKVEAWDASTGMAVPFRTSASRSTDRLAVSGDGSTLALVSASDLEGNSITVQDGASNAHLRTIEGPQAWNTALAIRPDGDEFTTGSRTNSLMRWSLVRGELEMTSPFPEAHEVESVSYDAAGAQIAWTAGSYYIRVREAKTGRVVRQWKAHGDQQVIFAAFLPGSTDLLTAARDGSVMSWDLSGLLPPRPTKPAMRFDEVARPAGKAVGTIGHPARRAALSADGAWLALDDNTGRMGVLSVKTGVVRWDTTVTTHVASETQRWIAFTADGSRLLLSGLDLIPDAQKIPRLTSSLRALDAASGALARAVYPETYGPVAALPDTIALGGFRPALLDAQTLLKKASITPVDRQITAIVAHPRRPAFLMSGDGGSSFVVSAAKGSIAAIMVATAGGDFMTATPEGAFLSSLDGARSVAWAFSSPLESFGFDQFASQFARPDLVKRSLAGEATDAPRSVSRPPQIELDTKAFAQGLAREVSAKSALPITTSDHIAIRAAVSSGRRVERVRAFVNGRPVADKLVCSSGATVDVDVPLQGGRNRVSLIAYDADGYASNPRRVDMISTAKDAARPDLWLLTVGVSRYENLGPEHQLEYADDDARSIAQALAAEAGPGKPFGRVHVDTLLDGDVTVESLDRAVLGLSSMAPGDLAVVFLAGHGVRLPEGNMVFLTSKAAMNGASARANGVGWDRIQAALSRAKGRVVVLLDACHSGHVSTDIVVANESLAEDLAAKGRVGVLVFAAARGSQLSYEVSPGGLPRGGAGSRGLELVDDQPKPVPPSLVGGHGLFTSAVLEALSGGAPDRDQSGAIEVGEFIDFVTWRVKSMSSGAQTPWIARREMFGDFVIAPAKP